MRVYYCGAWPEMINQTCRRNESEVLYKMAGTMGTWDDPKQRFL